jgi:hypothetical protein
MPNEPEATQDTQPRYDKGAEGPSTRIPAPTRQDVFRDLEKVAKVRKRPSVGNGKGGPEK